MISNFKIDWLTIWGLLAQGLFFLSFVVQWYKSEKKGESFLPVEFWWLRIAASIMLLYYVIERKDLVFLVSLLLQLVIYSRNIYLIKKK